MLVENLSILRHTLSKTSQTSFQFSKLFIVIFTVFIKYHNFGDVQEFNGLKKGEKNYIALDLYYTCVVVGIADIQDVDIHISVYHYSVKM